MLKNIYLDNDRTPFSASRLFLKTFLSEKELQRYGLPLRPIFHTEAVERVSLSDRQPISGQIRFYTKNRCLRDFRSVVFHLKSLYPEGIKLIANKRLISSDIDFFNIISQYIPLEVEFKYGNETYENDRNEEIIRILQGLSSNEDWKWLRNRIECLLNCGDSWTSLWLSEAVLESHKKISSEVYDVMGLSYSLQDKTAQAEKLFRLWRDEEGIHRARANYSLAMLYTRHHPLGFRDDPTAENLLNEAWEILSGLKEDNEQVYYESIFNRNGIALIYYRRGDIKLAAEMLATAITNIEQTSFRKGLHQTVLTNNLGRVYAASGDESKAEKYLKSACEVDPEFSEYWMDLSIFYKDYHRYDAALWSAHERNVAQIP